MGEGKKSIMTEKNFKGVDKDPARMAEYKERQRMSLVLEEFYKLKTEYEEIAGFKNADDMMVLMQAYETIVSKEKAIDSK